VCSLTRALCSCPRFVTHLLDVLSETLCDWKDDTPESTVVSVLDVSETLCDWRGDTPHAISKSLKKHI